MANFNDYITPDERSTAWKLGATLALGGMDKQAAVAIPDFVSLGGMAKLIATTALLTGAPIGLTAHIIGQKVSAVREKEDKLLQEAQFYRNASKQMEYGLRGTGV